MSNGARRAVLALMLPLLGAAMARAGDEIRWRYDYTAARRESQQSGRPMFLDFSTEWCGPCKKLDRTTFRDPAVVQLLNDQYIPVKLDGTKEKGLVEVLGVQVYPTLILAGADGRILKTIEGYIEAPRCREQLQEVIAGLPVANQTADKPRPPVEVKPAVGTGERPARPVARIEPAPMQRRQRAGELLTQAKGDLRELDYLCCLEKCVTLVQGFADLPEAAEAGQMLEQLRGNPAHLAAAADRLSNRLAEIYLVMGETRQAQGDFKQAVACLERAMLIAPGSPVAEAARLRLAAVKNAVTNRNDIQK